MSFTAASHQEADMFFLYPRGAVMLASFITANGVCAL